MIILNCKIYFFNIFRVFTENFYPLVDIIKHTKYDMITLTNDPFFWILNTNISPCIGDKFNSSFEMEYNKYSNKLVIYDKE